MKTPILIVAALAAAITVGCKNPDDEYEPAVVPKTVNFQGQTDAKYVGNWTTKDRMSQLEIAADGTVQISTTVASAGGKGTTKVQGKWLAEKDRLLFKYGQDAQATTLEYQAKLSGNGLSLQQPGGKLITTYVKK